MKSPRDLLLALCAPLAALALTGCVGTTGGDLVTFNAAASGPKDAVAGKPYMLPAPTDLGYQVTLRTATLHVGAVYLNSAIPVSGSGNTDCVLPGIYVAEVAGGLDVDLLSPDPQPFPVQGEGTATPAVVGEVWLMHGDVNDTGDTAPILELDGTAVGNGATYPFQASLTIGENRLAPVDDPALPSEHPICKQHIVSPIRLATDVTQEITPQNGGSLLLRIQPAALFDNVDFSALAGGPSLYTFADTSTDQPSTNLYRNLHADYGVYEFSWVDAPNP